MCSGVWRTVHVIIRENDCTRHISLSPQLIVCFGRARSKWKELKPKYLNSSEPDHHQYCAVKRHRVFSARLFLSHFCHIFFFVQMLLCSLHVCLLPQTWHVHICHVSAKSGKENTTLVPGLSALARERSEEFGSFGKK